jgi:L-ascorbate metabolism protein UlaG (beta-lactamase superfamily)
MLPVVRACVVILAVIAEALWSGVARASSADRCLAVAQAPARVVPAALRLADLQKNEVSLTFVGHATFLIESAGGIRIVTDYNDYVRPPVVPDIATMNRAHSTHFTDAPDPAIKHVLRGWGPNGNAISHDLELGDVRVRNVVTNIRDYAGGTQLYANSIFIFETAGLCIAHLGHLHHTLTPKHLEQIGQIDIALVPVDGSYTLDLTGMVEVIKALHARLVIPMHYFSTAGLDRFLDRLEGEFPVTRSSTPVYVASKKKLPPRAEILVLPGN